MSPAKTANESELYKWTKRITQADNPIVAENKLPDYTFPVNNGENFWTICNSSGGFAILWLVFYNSQDEYTVVNHALYPLLPDA